MYCVFYLGCRSVAVKKSRCGHSVPSLCDQDEDSGDPAVGAKTHTQKKCGCVSPKWLAV